MAEGNFTPNPGSPAFTLQASSCRRECSTTWLEKLNVVTERSRSLISNLREELDMDLPRDFEDDATSPVEADRTADLDASFPCMGRGMGCCSDVGLKCPEEQRLVTIDIADIRAMLHVGIAELRKEEPDLEVLYRNIGGGSKQQSNLGRALGPESIKLRTLAKSLPDRCRVPLEIGSPLSISSNASTVQPAGASEPQCTSASEAEMEKSGEAAGPCSGEELEQAPVQVQEGVGVTVPRTAPLAFHSERWRCRGWPEPRHVWEVVGGSATGGIVVRTDRDPDSPLACTLGPNRGRLATSALVDELERWGTRLRYELLSGQGPRTGWVSTMLNGEELLRELPRPPAPEHTTPAQLRELGVLGLSTPRIFWTFWDSGFEGLPSFHRLCVQSWHRRHPQWTIQLVADDTIYNWVDEEELPSNFQSLKVWHRSDCVKSALLLKYGGIYMDPTILALRSVTDLVRWEEDMEQGSMDYVGFFRGERDVVENWFMGCRRGCELMEQWGATQKEYWEQWNPKRPKAFARDKFFEGVSFRNFGPDEDGSSEDPYLVQHACFLKLCARSADFRRMAATKTHRLDCGLKGNGGIWLNRWAQARARLKIEQALRRSQNRRFAAFTAAPQEIRGRLALEQVLMGEDHAGEVPLHVPFAKFTVIVTSWLRKYSESDLLRRPSTLRSLMLRALGPMKPAPPRRKDRPG